MGRLLIRQKVFSWTDTYDVYDEFGNPKYYVKADFFTIGHRIRVYSRATGEEIGLIQEKVLRIFREFEISFGGYSQGIIKQQFSFFRPKYNLDYKGWHLEGDIMAWSYEIYEQNRLVVTISKELFHWGDTYVINFANNNDELPALMTAIAMDAAICSAESANNTMM